MKSKISSEVEFDEENSCPLGSWNDLNPSFWVQVRALFKKQFLIKIRHVVSIIEVIIALLLCLAMFPIYLFATDNFPEIKDAEIEYFGNFFSQSLFVFFSMNDDSKILAKPNNDKMKELLMNMPRLNFMISGIDLPQYNITLPKREIQYFDTYKEMEDKIYESDSNGVAFSWENWNDTDCYENPIFEVYMQSMSFISPDLDFYLELEQAAAKLAFEKKSKDFGDSIVNETYSIQIDNNFIPTIVPPNLNISLKQFDRPKITVRYPQICLALGFIASFTFVLATMPDMEAILSEKDTHVSALMLLMGMSETAYWFVNFLTPFILSLVCYIFSSIIYTYWFGLKGSDFTFLLVTSMFFVISQLWCIFFLSVFIKKASNGRVLTVIMAVFVIFVSYLHAFLTLDNEMSNAIIQNIFCIIPFSAYELFMMQAYIAYVQKTVYIKWNDMNNKGFVCPLWIPFMWLIIDSFIYFILFFIFNATYPRPFGTQIIKWSEIFDKNAWKRIFKKRNNLRVSIESEQFIEVSELSKIYHETKDVTALEGVSFDIKVGEVIVMIGPNGAGKSTLMNIIAGAIEPTSGIIKFFGGNETTRFKDIQHYLGVCFQDNVIINLLSVREHFELFGAIRGVRKNILEDCIDYFSANMQLTQVLNSRAGDLSGGQKRKLCIGLSLLGNPPIVLMDEPTAGVDVQARQLIWKMISNLKETTTIVTSHALEEAEAVSSRLFIVAGGKIPFCGNSTELRREFKCGYLLRVEREDGTAGPVLELAQSFIPESHLSEERKDTISMPVNSKVPDFLESLSEKESEYGVKSYDFSVEQLEDMLLKLIQNEEVNH
ncbi:hypothetical protein M9Y10_003369 [Tritrichomonas musculus]|uniref:ABC transporter domain-containing protein n=1 Tax=Tritrichomonas musculus TaxID=1915356 RepID=A0ABR2JS22_9EUKA